MAASQEPVSQSVTLYCSACGEESSTARRFCGRCGQLLWEPCLGCGESNPVQESYCGKCGDDLSAGVQAARQELLDRLSSADELADQGRYLDALDKLEDVVVADHSQLKDLAAEVRERVESYPTQREQAIKAGSQAVGEVQELLTHKELFKAHEQLLAIPQAFRNQQVRELLEKVASAVEEVKQLRMQIRAGMESQKYDGLIPQLRRLLDLNSDEPEAKQLLQQLEARQQKIEGRRGAKLVQVATEAVKNCDYKRAATALQQLPPGTEERPDYAKAIAGAKECVWLAECLRTEPFITPALRAVADRLTKLQPQDQRHAELASQLDLRWKKAIGQKSPLPAPWAKPAGGSQFGIPVTLLPLPTPLTSLKATRGSTSQSLLVAFGLALQGLEKSAVTLDLSPQKKTLWLKRLAKRSKKAAPGAWGLDIGGKRLKAMRLSWDESASKVVVDQSIVIPVERSEGQDEDDYEPIKTAIDKFVAEHPLEGEVVVLNIPGAQTLGRFFTLPAPKPEKFFEAVAYEVQARVPQAVEELVFDYHWFDAPPLHGESDAEVPRRRVALVAANRRKVEERCELLGAAGVERLIVQSGAVALANAVRFGQDEAQGAGGAASAEPVAVVEIGADTSNFVVLYKSQLWFRGLYQGVSNFDRALAFGMKIKRREAQQLRNNPAKAIAMHQLDALLQPEFDAFAEELHRTIDRCRDEIGEPISKLLLAGAGAEQLGLLRSLQSGG